MLKNPTSIFKLEEDVPDIQPNNSQFLHLSVEPLTAGIFTDVLFFAIKDNPMIGQINLSAFCCTIKFDIRPNIVRFNRMVVDATETIAVSASNNSCITIFWKFNDVGNALKYFKISKLYGYIKPMSEDIVKFTLTPKTVVDIGPFLLEVVVRGLILPVVVLYLFYIQHRFLTKNVNVGGLFIRVPLNYPPR